MSALPRRYRSSTSASNSTPTKSKSLEVLTALLDGVDPAAGPRCEDGYPDASKLVKGLRQIAQHVGVASNSSHQDDFRHARGFERILDVLRAFSGFYDPKKRSDVDMLLLFTLLGECLTVLSAALRDHAGNRRFFRFKVEGGGWESLEQTIASIGLGGAEPDPWISCHVFGKLLAFALDDEGPDLLCTSIAKTLHSSQDDSLDDSTGEIKNNSKYTDADIGGDEQWDLVLAKSIEISDQTYGRLLMPRLLSGIRRSSELL
uniref:Alfy-like armadillo-like repeat domain-containing protein n=1 Tax=Bionectria ochroleuca TaxID=29856 RepID=A0A8H7NJE3_BIOOC